MLLFTSCFGRAAQAQPAPNITSDPAVGTNAVLTTHFFPASGRARPGLASRWSPCRADLPTPIAAALPHVHVTTAVFRNLPEHLPFEVVHPVSTARSPLLSSPHAPAARESGSMLLTSFVYSVIAAFPSIGWAVRAIADRVVRIHSHGGSGILAFIALTKWSVRVEKRIARPRAGLHVVRLFSGSARCESEKAARS